MKKGKGETYEFAQDLFTHIELMVAERELCDVLSTVETIE
jgi:hypothetical protein